LKKDKREDSHASIEDIVAVICDDIDGECVIAYKKDFMDKHLMIRHKVGRHKLPAKNLRGQLIEQKEDGWTDMQTLVIFDLTKENLQSFVKKGYKIPEELLK
jgi:hypothetical protein